MSELKVIVSSSPHIRDSISVPKIMRMVFLALLPAAIWGIYCFGIQALLILLTSIITAVLSEYIYEVITRQKITIGDFSAALTGLLLGMITSPSTPLWVIAIGSACSIIIAKQLFGGIGSNFINPALFGRAVIFLSWTGLLNKWPEPQYNFLTILSRSNATQIVTSATPLDLFRSGNLKISTSLYLDLFFGRIGGSIGETSKFLLILGFIVLILIRRDIIDIKIPTSIILTVALLSLIFRQDPLFHILSGGLIIGALFMATDYVTSPITNLGKIIYGIGIGALTFIIRNWGIYPEGVSFAILSMNVVTPFLDQLKPRIFGTGGKK
ncbi:MAG: RnfABCDGE type electron transport complex subunit D [Caldisericia bacterium]|jgi:electron transport complex protein RnfD|nr:RnfABCDGE type electron transport complex subunit D [Caldisericia bacterium]